ncbi:oxidoreductase [Candidatus Aerophobetes bacterium]|uniref:Oxidoreductase n=1 Tax=Aerophobetes bacterium TaxID=2030807 RepID=A0A2A4X0F4_UNCAE|nr:MAG: oxidoreductase [Candidatus Aerophobetes bacterium]
MCVNRKGSTVKRFRFWQVDAFTSEAFKGNPAAVFFLEEQIDDALMQNIAMEMNLSETAFVLLREGKNPFLRWFKPTHEVDLCGHATLASAHIYFSEIEKTVEEVTFETKQAGCLKVLKSANTLTMNFPLFFPDEVAVTSVPEFVLNGLSSTKPVLALDLSVLMLVYDNEKTVLEMEPNLQALAGYTKSIIVTSKSSSSKYDYVSRFFSMGPNNVLEDPATGSAHCFLAPFWSKQLSKTELSAYQASKRQGFFSLHLQKEHVAITGQAVTTVTAGFLAG